MNGNVDHACEVPWERLPSNSMQLLPLRLGPLPSPRPRAFILRSHGHLAAHRCWGRARVVGAIGVHLGFDVVDETVLSMG